MSLYGLSRNHYQYTGDDGSDYVVGTTDDNAAVQAASPISPAGQAPLPRGWKPRHVIGRSIDGQVTRVPVFNESSSLWGADASFTKNGIAFDVQSRIGELRTLKR